LCLEQIREYPQTLLCPQTWEAVIFGRLLWTVTSFPSQLGPHEHTWALEELQSASLLPDGWLYIALMGFL